MFKKKIKFSKLIAFVHVIGLSHVNHGFYLVWISDEIQQKCRCRTYKHAKKPAEQNMVKLYDPIGMTPLSLPGLFCSTFYIPSR